VSPLVVNEGVCLGLFITLGGPPVPTVEVTWCVWTHTVRNRRDSDSGQMTVKQTRLEVNSRYIN